MPELSDEFTVMYRVSCRRIAATLVLTGSSSADAADLTADAFVRAWERGGRVGRVGRLAPGAGLTLAVAVVLANVIGTGVFLKARVMTCNVGTPEMVLLVWRCGLVVSPGHSNCTQQPMVGIVGPPVRGCVYSSNTPS